MIKGETDLETRMAEKKDSDGVALMTGQLGRSEELG